MGMTSLSIVLTVFVLQLHHMSPNQKPVPRWVKRVVIDYIARVICMRSHIVSYYRYRDDASRIGTEAVCLTSFMEGADYKDGDGAGATHSGGVGNCNGRTNRNPIDRLGMLDNEGSGGVGYDDISRHLAALSASQDIDVEYEDMVNEWRLVAHIMDRFLFWIFLIGTTMSSVCILVIRPMTKPSI